MAEGTMGAIAPEHVQAVLDIEEFRMAGDRLALMLHAQMGTRGYGSPEHEDRCREALREWEALASPRQLPHEDDRKGDR